MPTNASIPRHLPLPQLLLAVLLALPAAAALAQYKVVNPDGSISYTDRPPADAKSRVTPMRGGTPVAASTQPELPAELRKPAQTYPVTLYTTSECPPCDNARQLLQRRGIPYSERLVTTEEDARALEAAVGGRTLPSLTIGAQPLRGVNEGDWNTYLDAAGYPRTSKLPPNWPTPRATPMVARAAPPAAPASRQAPPPPTTPNPAEQPGGIRF
ncbi:MAG: glutaredoxin family protein [Burkholderiales bacterium]|nr:glutaredoxin family protein [Burkholderiales bacterium]